MKKLAIFLGVFVVLETAFLCSVSIPNCEKCVNLLSDVTISTCESCKTGYYAKKDENFSEKIEFSCFKNSENCHIYNSQISECVICDSQSTFATSKDGKKYCKEKKPLLSFFLYLLFLLLFFIIYCSITLKIVFTSEEFSTFIGSLRKSKNSETKNIEILDPNLPLETEQNKLIAGRISRVPSQKGTKKYSGGGITSQKSMRGPKGRLLSQENKVNETESGKIRKSLSRKRSRRPEDLGLSKISKQQRGVKAALSDVNELKNRLSPGFDVSFNLGSMSNLPNIS